MPKNCVVQLIFPHCIHVIFNIMKTDPYDNKLEIYKMFRKKKKINYNQYTIASSPPTLHVNTSHYR